MNYFLNLKIKMNELVVCYIRRLLNSERDILLKKTGNKYKWVTEGEAKWKNIIIPIGFLSDGSTGGPDYSDAWLFHDYLYRTHKIRDKNCTRQEADNIMIDILKFQRHFFYAFVVKWIFKLNPLWIVSKAWNNAGKDGPQFYCDYLV